MTDRDRSRLQDMLDNARKVMQFAQGQTRETLDSDEMFAYAVIHALEIIGEAARNVSSDVQAQAVQIEWRSITSMRHRMAHDYMNVDHDVVWNVIQNRIPELIDQLETLLSTLTD